MTVLLLVIHTIYSLVLSPLSVISQSNIDFMIPLLIDSTYFLTQISIVVGWLIGYAYIIYSAYRFGRRQALIMSGVFVASIIYKYLGIIASVTFLNGSFPAFRDIIKTVGFSCLFDFVLFGVVLLITLSIENKVSAFIKSKKALESQLPGYSFDERDLFFPFKKLFHLENPIQRNAFIAAIVISLSRIGQLLVNDIIAGPPVDLADFLWMVTYYLSGILLGFASYLFLLYIEIGLDRKDMKLQYSAEK